MPASIGDLFYLIFVLVLILWIFLSAKNFLQKRAWRGYIYINKILIFCNILFFVFHWFWGFNYYRQPLTETLGAKDIQLNELKSLADSLLLNAQTYREANPEDAEGNFTFDTYSFSEVSPQRIITEVEIDIPYKTLPNWSYKKASLFSSMMRYWGITGYFNPFTNEAQYINGVPTHELPFTLAHEQAHQAGYAPEAEASFIGYLTCIQSQNADLKYSANYSALKYVLSAIYRQDSAFVRGKLNQFSPAMKRDWQAERAYQEKYSGAFGGVF